MAHTERSRARNNTQHLIVTPGSGIFVNMSYFAMTSVFLTLASFYCPNIPLRVSTLCGNKKKYEAQMLSMMTRKT